MAEKPKKKEFGDFQTPEERAHDVCRFLAAEGIGPKGIIEPTCGVGSFVRAAAKCWPGAERIIGAEVNCAYLAEARGRCPDARVRFLAANFFDHDWTRTVTATPSPRLIVGNLPWVTNAEIGAHRGANLPPKSNFKGQAGFEAISGKANFDISEWMLLQMLGWPDRGETTVALLLKTSVARRILKYAWERGIDLGGARLYRIDARLWFQAAVEACLFVFGRSVAGEEKTCAVFDRMNGRVTSVLAQRDGEFVGDLRRYGSARRLLGGAPIRWRSGVKHDCSRVMEFTRTARGLINGLGEMADLEPTFLYPLFKSSQLARGETLTNRVVLVTQTTVGEPTEQIRRAAPKTWKYLRSHGDALDARRSAIYRKNPRFSIFGVGNYSFSPWKVAISGLYKQPRFVVLGRIDGKPSMVDDTACFLSFENGDEAQAVSEALNSAPAMEFFSVFGFSDAKRPFTIELLARLNLEALVRQALGPKRLPKALQREVCSLDRTGDRALA